MFLFFSENGASLYEKDIFGSWSGKINYDHVCLIYDNYDIFIDFKG